MEPVRVPWLHYSNAPARRAPDSRPTADETTAIPEHTPLLTDEELQALMGPSDFNDANCQDDEPLEGRLRDDTERDDTERGDTERGDIERDDRMEFGQ